MSKLADEIELADAHQVIAQAERYLRFLRNEGEYAPKPKLKSSWIDRIFPMPTFDYSALLVPYCPSKERVEWAEMVLAKQGKAA